MTPPARRSAASLVARLKTQFKRHRNANGVFPILDSLQTRVAWSRFPNTAQDGRPAAVLIPIVAVLNPQTNIDEFHVVFTQRSSHMRTHAAEISFPGGGLEEKDDTLIDTALRETQEELLHDPDQFQWTVIGQGSAVPSIRGIPVTPVLAVGSSDNDQLILPSNNTSSSINDLFPGSPDEVQRVFSISIEELLQVETTRPLPGRLGTPAPVFPVRIEDGDEETVDIWGLTAFVLQPILHKVLKPALVTNGSEDEDATNSSRSNSKL